MFCVSLLRVLIRQVLVHTFNLYIYINLLFNQFSHGSCAILGKYRIFESYEEALNFKKRFLRIYDKYINNIIKQNRDELTELKKTHTWL